MKGISSANISYMKVGTHIKDLNVSYLNLNFITFQLKMIHILAQWAIVNILSLKDLNKDYPKIILRKKSEPGIALNLKKKMIALQINQISCALYSPLFSEVCMP